MHQQLPHSPGKTCSCFIFCKQMLCLQPQILQSIWIGIWMLYSPNNSLKFYLQPVNLLHELEWLTHNRLTCVVSNTWLWLAQQAATSKFRTRNKNAITNKTVSMFSVFAYLFYCVFMHLELISEPFNLIGTSTTSIRRGMIQFFAGCRFYSCKVFLSLVQGLQIATAEENCSEISNPSQWRNGRQMWS